jgi:hypothetical protein
VPACKLGEQECRGRLTGPLPAAFSRFRGRLSFFEGVFLANTCRSPRERPTGSRGRGRRQTEQRLITPRTDLSTGRAPCSII